MDKLTQLWNESKTDIPAERLENSAIIRKAEERDKSILLFHLGNLLILVPTLILLSYYFYHVQFQHWLSKAGSYLMLSGLFVRIVIEIISYIKFRKINYVKSAAKASDDTYIFYSFRKKVHGPVTIAIIILYVIGVGLLTPEVAIYIPMHWLIIMHTAFIVTGSIVIWKVRQGINEELGNLRHLVDVRKQINE